MLKKVFFTKYSDQSVNLPFVLSAVGLNHSQEYINRPSGLPAFQLIYTVKGKGVLELDDKQFIVEKGNGILLFPNIGHRYYRVSNEWKVHFLLFSGYGIKDLFKNIGIEQSSIYKLNNTDKIENHMEELFVNNTQDNSNEMYEYSGKLYNILLEFLKSTTIQNANSFHKQNSKVYMVMDFINQHYMDPIVLSDLAAKVHLSKEYLCQLFKRVNGFSIFDYITDVRLANARTLLIQDRNEKIKNISRLCGYEDVSYFGKVFKKKIGITPAKFRELH
ncbi:helix-turn-helix domain-containing protein [Gracilibacillus sp. YIM 98692]|uniref:helix-turn-helix domain-containing protein n=1 Tax=Gracilibacillus sp. YIM 98692 TaxID=2663532 RepID=UPI0013D876E3|nr:helix-turn-helix domain-containing protein [Gracilibacillus sp. YIM 98692]